MEVHHEMNRRNTVVKRAIVVAISVILALVVAAPIASGQSSSQGKNLGKGQNLGKLTGDWWNWAVSTRPSPLNGGDPCGGNFVDGVFFLGGSFTIDPVTRTCTVPANTPILFPVVNTACSAAPTVQQPDGTFTGDPKPYTKCSKDLLDQTVLANSTMFATLNGQPLKIQRLESGPFTFTVPSPDGSEIVPNAPPGSYDAAASGFWVYLPQGLEPGTYTLHWGGSFANGGFTQDITYILTVVD
jgi:hypothetical protein